MCGPALPYERSVCGFAHQVQCAQICIAHLHRLQNSFSRRIGTTVYVIRIEVNMVARSSTLPELCSAQELLKVLQLATIQSPTHLVLSSVSDPFL